MSSEKAVQKIPKLPIMLEFVSVLYAQIMKITVALLTD